MKTSLYLPDDLADQVRTYGISVSEIAQTALRKEIGKMQAKERATSDLEEVAARLRETIDEDAANHQENGRKDGVRWAREAATAAELRTLADFTAQHGYPLGWQAMLESARNSLDEMDSAYVASLRSDQERDLYWKAFGQGAIEVWESVRALV